MAQDINTTEAKQGEGARSLRILWICGISTGAAILLAVVGSWLLFSTPAEEARGDLPQAQSPNTDGAEGLPPAGGPRGG